MAAATKPTTRARAKNTQRGTQHSDDLKNYWTGPHGSIKFGDDEWRAHVLRGRGRSPLDISDLITTVEWLENGPILTGTVNLTKPADHPKLDISEGHQVKLEHRRMNGGRWTELWRMRLGGTLDNAGVTIDPKEDTYEFTLADELAQVQRTKANFKVRKDKQNPKGVRVDIALTRFCKQERIPHRPFPRMREHIKKQTFHQQGIVDILQALLRQENTNSARADFILRWRTGKVEVVRKQREPFMTEFSDTLISAALSQQRRSDFATIIKVDATAEKGKGKDAKAKSKRSKKHIRTTVTRPSLQERYGKITKTFHVQADSLAEARKKGKKELARITQPKSTVSFTHPGIPGVRRWSAVQIDFPDQDFSELCYVTSARHTVSSGDYTMDVDVEFSDPFKKVKKKKKTKTKRDAARKRGRAHDDTNEGDRDARPKPKTHTQHSDSPTPKPYTPPRKTPGDKLSDRGRT